MLFSFPYALTGLAVVAGLVAVYTFRARFRRRPVSSLMLWRQTQRPRLGGAHRDRLRLPPLFYLELAVLAALILAALSPHIRRPNLGTLTVVFDTSASMSARDENGLTPQIRAARALQGTIRQAGHARVRLLLARATGPESASPAPPSQSAARLRQIPCHDPGDSLSASLARANELSGPADEILVLTDRAPDAVTHLRPGVRWLAFGRPQVNRALTTAERTWSGQGRESLLIEAVDYGAVKEEIPLRVAPLAAGGAPLFEGRLAVDDQGRARQRLDLPPGTPELVVELPPDALELDNRAILLADPPRPVAVAVQVENDAQRRVVERALDATQRARRDAPAPHLVITDRPSAAGNTPGAPWHCILTAPKAPRLVRGPYLADRAHPLLEGVSFEGLTWSAGTNQLPGRVLLFAGNLPLISLDSPPRGSPTLHIVSAGAGDALYRAPAWPALVWNLLQACADVQPGPPRRNLRAGVAARFAAEPQQSLVHIETPSGKEQLRARGGHADWMPTEPGLYRMRLGDNRTEPFAVNFQAPAESDLRLRQQGTWGEMADTEHLRRTHRSVAWVAGLAALLLAGLHHVILGAAWRRGGMLRDEGSRVA